MMHSESNEIFVKRSQELVKKWNREIADRATGFFREQLSVFQAVSENLTGLKEDANSTGDPRYVAIHTCHSGNATKLQSVFQELYSRTEIREFINGMKAQWLSDIRESVGESAGSAREKRSRRMLFGSMLNEYIAFVVEHVVEVQKQLINEAHRLFEWEGELIRSDYQPAIPGYPKVSLNPENSLKHLEKFFPSYKDTLQFLADRSGTWKLPVIVMQIKGRRNLKRALRSADSTVRLWAATSFAFYEDWRFREELFRFISGINLMASQTLTSYSTKLSKVLIPLVEQKRKYLEDLTRRIPDPDQADPATLKHFFYIGTVQAAKRDPEPESGRGL